LALTFTRIIGLLVFVAVSLLLASGPVHQPWLLYTFKPLASALILLIPLARWKRHHNSFTFWITVGLLFSFFGDLLLLLPNRFFIHGLFAFLLAHVFYLVAFSRGIKFPAHLYVWFIYISVGAYLFLFLYATLPSGFGFPVILYVFFVSSMAAQAMGRFLTLKNRPAAYAAIGALLFMLSDSFLSFDRFHSHIPAAAFFVLIPYYLGQWFIALSTYPAPTEA
jgi:uncharacterized membrane protein YhhN